jgi:hypothetical protein
MSDTEKVYPFVRRKRAIMVRYTGDENETCCICFEKLCKAKYVKKLPCNHLFHSGCIAGWDKKKTCPMCRANYKYSSYHNSPFATRWVFEENAYNNRYFGPSSAAELKEYWDYGYRLRRIRIERQWRPCFGRPKTIYYKVLKQLKKKMRRRATNADPVPSFLYSLLSGNISLDTGEDDENSREVADTAHEISAILRIMNILQLPLAVEPLLRIPEDEEPLLRIPEDGETDRAFEPIPLLLESEDEGHTSGASLVMEDEQE